MRIFLIIAIVYFYELLEQYLSVDVNLDGAVDMFMVVGFIIAILQDLKELSKSD